MTSPTVSTIIFTCNRPQYLFEALESVQRQTARQRIGQVIVSENGGTDDSRQVCAQFPKLPILYLQQRPPVPIMDHLKVIWPHVTEPLIASLHDDDWWEPEHLEQALAVLESDLKCTAVFSNFFENEGSQCPGQVSAMAWRVWISTGCDFSKPVLNLSQEQTTSACLIGTSFHYSTVVARAGAFYNVYCKIRSTGNSYDNDRTFPIFLTAHGHLAYLTTPDVHIRIHPQRDAERFEGNARQLMAETTRFINKTWPELVSRAITRLNETLGNLTPGQLQRCTFHLLEAYRTCLIEECGLNLRPINQIASQSRNLQWYFKKLCPPVIFGLVWRVKSRIAARGNQA